MRSGTGTSFAKGPNSTWSMTINPPRLTQTPHAPQIHNHPMQHGKNFDFTTSCQVFSSDKRLLKPFEQFVSHRNRTLFYFMATDKHVVHLLFL